MPLRKGGKRENAEGRGEGGSWPIKGLKGQSVTAEMKWVHYYTNLCQGAYGLGMNDLWCKKYVGVRSCGVRIRRRSIINTLVQVVIL